MKLVDMKLPKLSKKEMEADCKSVCGPEQDRWPYGLQLRFEKEQVKKLPELAEYKVGDKVIIQAEATVTSIRMSERQNGETDHTVEMQIEQIGCVKMSGKPAETMSMKEYRKMREGKLMSLGEVLPDIK